MKLFSCLDIDIGLIFSLAVRDQFMRVSDIGQDNSKSGILPLLQEWIYGRGFEHRLANYFVLVIGKEH